MGPLHTRKCNDDLTISKSMKTGHFKLIVTIKHIDGLVYSNIFIFWGHGKSLCHIFTCTYTLQIKMTPRAPGRQYHRPQQRSMSRHLSVSRCTNRSNALSVIHTTNTDILGHSALMGTARKLHFYSNSRQLGWDFFFQ